MHSSHKNYRATCLRLNLRRIVTLERIASVLGVDLVDLVAGVFASRGRKRQADQQQWRSARKGDRAQSVQKSGSILSGIIAPSLALRGFVASCTELLLD